MVLVSVTVRFFFSWKKSIGGEKELLQKISEI